MKKEFEYRKYEGKFGTVKVFADASNELYFDAEKTAHPVVEGDLLEILCNGVVVTDEVTYKPVAITSDGLIGVAAADKIETFTAPEESE